MEKRKNKKSLSFLYIIQKPCGGFWTEENMSMDRIKKYKDNGCIIKSIAMGKKNNCKTSML